MSEAYEVPGFKPGVLVAGADLSAKQFQPVKLNSSGLVVLGGDGDLCLGILQNAPISGEACEIDMDGISKAVAGAALATPGTKLASNGTGKLIAAASAKHVVAVSLSTAGADGEILAVKIVGLSGQLLA